MAKSKSSNGTAQAAINWQNRIVGYKQVPANDLLANPLNARRHPNRQREALRGSLDTLGWVAPVIVNAATGYLLDGHARIEEALTRDENALIPVVEVELTEDEERLFLASYDWITGLAEYDRDALDNLLKDVSTDSAALQSMLAEQAQALGITPPDFQPIDISELPRLDQLEPKWIICPHCGERFDTRLAENG